MRNLLTIILISTLIGCNSSKDEKKPSSVSNSNQKQSEQLSFSNFIDNKEAIQHFEITNSRDTVITGNQGTEIFIAKNSFETNDKFIDFELIECYTLESFIANNLSTTNTNGDLLTSNGMLFMDSPNAKLVNPLKVKMPTKGNTESSLFYGTRDSTNTIRWQIDQQKRTPTKSFIQPRVKTISKPIITNETTAKQSTPEPPAFSNPFCIKCERQLKENIFYPPSLARKKTSGKVYFDLTIDYDGRVDEIELIQGMGNGVDEMIRMELNKLDSFVPGFVSSSATRTKIRYKFKIDGRTAKISFPKAIKWSNTKEQTLKAWQLMSESVIRKKAINDSIKAKKAEDLNNFKKKVKSNGSQTVEVEVLSTVSGYIFEITKMGWINCDYFRQGVKSSLLVEADQALDVYLIFNTGGNSAMRGRIGAHTGEYSFDKIPIRTNPRILALGGTKENPIVSFQQVTITDGRNKAKLTCDTMTYAKLHEILETL